MSDTPLELDWEAATPSAPVYAPGEVVTHPMFGEVVILAVDASGAFPVYTCRGGLRCLPRIQDFGGVPLLITCFISHHRALS